MIQGKKITGAQPKGQQSVVANLTAMSSMPSGSKSIDMKEKKEKQDVVIAALSVLSNATNKHLLQQQDTQNAARALAINLEDPVVVEKIWEKKGLVTLVTSLQRTLQYLRDARSSSSPQLQSLNNLSAHLHRCLWSLTTHAHFAKMSLRHNLPDIILECIELENRKKTPFVDCDKPSNSELTNQLAILYNLSAQLENVATLNSLGLITRLIPAIRSPSFTAQSIASLTVLHLVMNEETCNKVAEAGALEVVVNELQNLFDGAQTNVEWDVSELLQALFKLSTSEANKDKLVNAGALPVLVKFLLNGHERTKIFVLRCLWSLSFHPNNKFQMQCEPDLIGELNAKVASVHPLIRKHSQGILWVLHFGHSSNTTRTTVGANTSNASVNISGNGEHIEDIPSSLGSHVAAQAAAVPEFLVGEPGTHVYISVDEFEMNAIKRIKARLVGAGRNAVTLDESSTNSYIDSISSMIETASCVLMCCSLRYKENPEIRTEIEYAVDMGKMLIPIVIEENFRPDGWLASFIGNRPWLDMHHVNLIDANFPRLLKEVESYSWAASGIHNLSPPSTQGTSTSTPRAKTNLYQHGSNTRLGIALPENINSERSTEAAPYTEAEAVPTMATRRDHPLLQWTEEDVSSWVDTLNLSNYSPDLKTFPGRYLLQLQRMNASAPEFYYQTLEKKLGLTEVSDLLNFASALAQVVELSQTVTPFDNNSIAADDYDDEERKSDMSGARSVNSKTN